jgi:excisionase family DNA binding protein
MIEYTVKEVAWLERVDERTVRRWVDERKVRHRRTPGNGIRILYVQRHPADRRGEGRIVFDVQSPDISATP